MTLQVSIGNILQHEPHVFTVINIYGWSLQLSSVCGVLGSELGTVRSILYIPNPEDQLQFRLRQSMILSRGRRHW